MPLVYCVVLTLTQSEHDTDTISVLVICKIQNQGKCTTWKTSGTDGRLSFNSSEDLPFHAYIMYRMWMAHYIQWKNVPVSWSQWLTEREVQWPDTLQLGYFFLYLLTASVVFPMYSPSTRSVSANSGNNQPLSMLYWYIMCCPKSMLIQADSTCNAYHCLFVHYSTVCSK